MLPVVEKALESYTNNNGNIPRTGRTPKFSDTKVNSQCLSTEFLSSDIENRNSIFCVNHLHSRLMILLPGQISIEEGLNPFYP
jgi:hypothetical protein